MSAAAERGLLWFGRDLRVADNAAFAAAARDNQHLLCLFCIDERWFAPGQFGTRAMGAHRWRFLQLALLDLAEQLATLGLQLHVLRGDPAQEVGAVCERLDIRRVYGTRASGSYERAARVALMAAHPGIQWHEFDGATLFDQHQVAALGGAFPPTFSRFRRLCEDWPVAEPLGVPAAIPRSLAWEAGAGLPVLAPMADNETFPGGERAGHAHLNTYFASTAPSTYKETRNALDDWASSTKFSPWLAHGCLSPRQILQSLRRYEAQQGANDSTYWIFFELLWREYFQWYEVAFRDRLYAFHGISGRKPLTTFYPQRFAAWRNGRTPWPLVNACLQCLNQTGYLSNRGRQLAASCLINELQLDWRCGAAWFEQQLVDYDVASNWGNWQYIAGVGADARGGRHFNLEKQAAIFDPDGAFVARWTHPDDVGAVDDRDAADWPVGV